MPMAHPDYQGLLIYDWNKGERPKAGAFAVVKAYKGLTHLANQAYGIPSAYRLINRNAWNMQNLAYRSSSTNCGSKRVDPQGAFQDKAFIALCQADRPDWAKNMGFRYTPIWVPSEEMPLPTGAKKAGQSIVTPPISPALLKTPILLGDRKQTVPISAATATALQFAGRGTTVKAAGAAADPATIEQVMQQASVVPSDEKVMWVGIGLAVAAVAALMAFSEG